MAATIQIAEEIEVRASIEVTFAALLDQLAPYIALLACFIPAQRAMLIEPIVALRYG